MQIFVRPTIEITREAPIQNRHFVPVGTSNVSLDYVNPWRGKHTESACHERSEVVFNSARELLHRS
ncbi:hypothetical protein Taro_030585 [Colocasia esculenta]|uniref:Uncharacterized protein n=1 Tax=Colocasia esculenta TaxID=4460 RepID=A0A843VLS5_COLES|nr:hypothetical protein [Colocasia esculenta]